MKEDDDAEDPSVGFQLVVDQNLCIGIGQCELLEPDVFRLDEDSGLADVRGGATLGHSRALIVVDRCPSGAISSKALGSSGT